MVHHALCNLIEPRFERRFIADRYANRVGKGTHRALGHLRIGAIKGQILDADGVVIRGDPQWRDPDRLVWTLITGLVRAAST